MIFISYYTSGVYEKVLQDYLLPSLKRWNLTYDIAEIMDQGSWQLNTGMKCRIIKGMLLNYKQDLCFLDADATIESFPELLFNIPDEYNMAIHYLDWQLFWRNKSNQDQRELLSGTMVIKYNPQTIELLNEWIAQVKVQKNVKEQKVLEKLVLNNDKYKVFDLPPSYCAIKKTDGTIPNYIVNPVIIHNQVSRKYKNKGK